MLSNILEHCTFSARQARPVRSTEEWWWDLEGDAFYVVAALQMMGVTHLCISAPWRPDGTLAAIPLPGLSQCSLDRRMAVQGVSTHYADQRGPMSVAWIRVG